MAEKVEDFGFFGPPEGQQSGAPVTPSAAFLTPSAPDSGTLENDESAQGIKPRKKPKLRGPERMRAMAFIENLLVRRYRRAEIAKALRHEFGPLDDGQINMLFHAVDTRWDQEHREQREHRARQQREVVMNISKGAINEKDWRAAIEAEKLLARIDGTEAPKRILAATHVSIAAPDQEELMRFLADAEARPKADQDYYLAHGHWPEEAPKSRALVRAEGGPMLPEANPKANGSHSS